MLLLRRRAVSGAPLLQLLWFMATEGKSVFISCLEGGRSKQVMSQLIEEVSCLLLLLLLFLIISITIIQQL